MSSWRISDQAVEHQAKPCLCAHVYRMFLGGGMNRQGWGEEKWIQCSPSPWLPLGFLPISHVQGKRVEGRKKERATSPTKDQFCAFKRQRNQKYQNPTCSSATICGMQNPWKLLPDSLSQMFTVPAAAAQAVRNKFRLAKLFVLSNYNPETDCSLSYVIQHSLLSLFIGITCN